MTRYIIPSKAAERLVVTDGKQFSKRIYVLIRTNGPWWILRYAFYAFIFSVPFETASIGIESGYFSLSKMAGYLFIIVTLTQPKLCFKFPPQAFWCFIIYLCVYIILGSLQKSEFTSLIITRLFTLIQMLILFWNSYNLMRYKQVANGTIWALISACIISAILLNLGVTSEVETQGRITALDANPNTVAATLSLGLLALVGFAYGREKNDLKARFMFWICSGVLAASIVRTGSRGALIALVVGLLVFSLKDRSIRSKLKIGLIAMLTIGFLGWASYKIETVRVRWEKTLLEGDSAGRDEILPASWNLFLEKPLFGWGPVHHYFELGSRLGTKTMDTHNLYLWILTEVGLLGSLPFFAGLWFCLRAAWRARGSIQGTLPLALVVFLLTINVKGTWHNRKLFWVLLAYALASSMHAIRSSQRYGVIRSSAAGLYGG